MSAKTETADTAEPEQRSSYWNQEMHYGHLLQGLVLARNPEVIVEYGILDGFSLDIFCQCSKSSCQISAYDIFDKFVGNGADRAKVEARYAEHANVTIDEQDFYNSPTHLQDASVDILHIDIANNGDVYEFAVTNLMSKLKPDGMLLLEGGTPARDNVEWMSKYNKRAIVPYLQSVSSDPAFVVHTFGTFPGLTLIRRS